MVSSSRLLWEDTCWERDFLAAPRAFPAHPQLMRVLLKPDYVHLDSVQRFVIVSAGRAAYRWKCEIHILLIPQLVAVVLAIVDAYWRLKGHDV